jgi:hypothetical protein
MQTEARARRASVLDGSVFRARLRKYSWGFLRLQLEAVEGQKGIEEKTERETCHRS